MFDESSFVNKLSAIIDRAKFMLLSVFVTILSIANTFSQTKNVTGTWKGQFTQELTSSYPILVTFELSERNGTVSGTAITEYTDGTGNYAKWVVSGSNDGRIVRVNVDVQIEQKSPGFNWCKSMFTGVLSENGMEIYGNNQNDGEKYFINTQLYEGNFFRCGAIGAYKLTRLSPISKPPIPRDTLIPHPVPKIDPLPPSRKNDRPTKSLSSFTTNSDSVIISFYDGNMIDNDTISVFLNNKLILNHILLKAKPIAIKIPVLPKIDNIVTMYADNLGTIPPNTAAMEYIDGNIKKTIRLSSDLQVSGSINITRRSQ